MRKIISAILTLTIITATVPFVNAENPTKDTELDVKSDLYIDESVKDKVSQIAEVEIIELDEPLDVDFEIKPSSDIKLLSVDDEKSFFDYGGDWGYKDLDIRSNTEIKREIYNKLFDINTKFASDTQDVPLVDSRHVIAEIDLSEYDDFSAKDFDDVLVSFRADHPEFYWLPLEFASYINPETNEISIYLYIYEDYALGNTRSELNAEIQKNFEQYLKVIEGYSTNYEKALLLHSAICDNVEYGYDEAGDPLDTPFAHNIVGVLDGNDETDPVCESYAKTYQLLLNAAGVENVYVAGVTFAGVHAWNMIKMDNGKWYQTDITNDDPNLTVANCYVFFLADKSVWDGNTHIPFNSTEDEYLGYWPNEFFYQVPELEPKRYVFKGDSCDISLFLEYKIGNDGFIEITKCRGDAYGTVEIPGEINGVKVTSIGNEAFKYCHLLYSVTIPESVIKISEYAFQQIPNDEYRADGGILEYVEIKGDIEGFGYAMFQGCNKLKKVIFTGHANSDIFEGNGFAFAGCTSLEEVTLPEGMSQTGGYTFSGCTSLRSITLPESLVWLDSNAFENCVSLTEIHIPSKVQLFFGDAFSGCYNLEKISVDEDNEWYTVVDNAVFTKDMSTLCFCTNREEYTIPDTVCDFDRAFVSCNKLKHVAMHDNINSIGVHAFENCTVLDEISLPDGLTHIGIGTFKNCKSLKEVNIPDTVTDINAEAFWGCEGLTQIILPQNLSSLGGEAFRECVNIESVYIPDSVNNLGYGGMFYGCTSLEYVHMPNSIKEIPQWTFEDCVSLKHIEIPDSVTKICQYAFWGSGLEEINFPSKLKVIERGAFMATSPTEIIVPESVTEIGESVFAGCLKLKSVELPDSITAISAIMFDGCKALENIQLPEKLTEIGMVAFQSCESLKEIKFPKGVQTIGENAFFGCGLTSVTLPDSLKTIGERSFGFNDYLTEVNFNENLESIGNYAFADSIYIEELTIPYSVKTIGHYAFNMCAGIGKVVIPPTVTNIGKNAFDTDHEGWHNPEFTFYGVAGSEAQRYAEENGIPFIETDPIDITSYKCTQDGNKYTFTAEFDNVLSDCRFIAVLYSDGALSGFGSVPISAQQKVAEIEIESDTADSAKIFLWSGLNSIMPIYMVLQPEIDK